MVYHAEVAPVYPGVQDWYMIVKYNKMEKRKDNAELKFIISDLFLRSIFSSVLFESFPIQTAYIMAVSMTINMYTRLMSPLQSQR